MSETLAGRYIRSTPPSPDMQIAALAGRQHGVVTVAQLLAAGLDRNAIARRVAQGRLIRISSGVYAVGHAGLSREGRCMVGGVPRRSGSSAWPSIRRRHRGGSTVGRRS